MITFLFSLYSVQFIHIRLHELTQMSPMALGQSRVCEFPPVQVSRLCGLAASTFVVVNGALPDVPLLRSGIYLGGDLPLYHSIISQLRTHQAALRTQHGTTTSFLQLCRVASVSLSCQLCGHLCLGNSLPFRWEVVLCCSLTCAFLMACVLLLRQHETL